jgi:hypothetical protein
MNLLVEPGYLTLESVQMDPSQTKDSGQTNRQGLKRYIEADIRRQIRQRDGFGCVVCGVGLYTYEHVDPTYAEADKHDPNAMTLLCYGCQGKVTSRMLSKETVKEAMKNPFCKRKGFSNALFDFGMKTPTLKFAGVTTHDCQIPLIVAGQTLFKVEAPEEKGTPFRLSGVFYDSTGERSLEIDQNNWAASSDNWDVEVIGPAITIREKAGKIHLKLVADAPNGLIVERLDMTIEGRHIVGNQDTLTISFPNGKVSTLTNCIGSGSPVGLMIG